MKYLKSILTALPVVLGMGGSAMAQEEAPATGNDLVQDIIAIHPEIDKCEVNSKGIEQITLKNGDVIQSVDFVHDSYSVGVKNPESDVAILDTRNGIIMGVSDICARTDVKSEEHPNQDIKADETAYPYLCVADGFKVDVFEVESGEFFGNDLTSIKAMFHDVNSNETFLGSCEFEIEGQVIQAPLTTLDIAQGLHATLP